MNETVSLRLRVKSATWEAPNIISYDLRSPEGAPLPAFTAGAHIDLALPNGLVRSYSLLNAQTERHRYVLAVQKDRASRGGSRWVHENLRAGDVLEVSVPRNNFPLDELAPHSIFIAGGIGITPMLSMIERLGELDRSWELVYCTRTREGTPFREALAAKAGVSFNFDEEPGGRMLDIPALIASAPADAHFYCCGPTPMLDAFEAATLDLPRERVHVEYFSAKEAPAVEGGFTVVLAKSGRELPVAPGKTILDTLRDAGLDMRFSCTEGVCGTCETRVIEGVPDHRDRILTDAERAANRKMMICCSGSKSDRLVLDL
ncbi:MAG: 2Fe-2S iron-sulfur cluster-binding protein [Burkholderiales bacterium]